MINKYSSIPLYSQLKSLIIDKIDRGEFAEDTKIPSEQELCEHYDISRPTVRQAIAELTNNGYLYKLKGKGTFVAKKKTKIEFKSYSGFTDSILDSQDPGQQNIISMKAVSRENVTDVDNIFGNAMGQSQFAEITYVTLHNNDAISLNTSYIPLNLFPDIIEDIKAKKPSYDIMKGKYPLLPVKTRSSLEIVYTEQLEAQYLQVQTGQALICVENQLSSKSGQVVEFVIAKYRADKCRLCFENNK